MTDSEAAARIERLEKDVASLKAAIIALATGDVVSMDFNGDIVARGHVLFRTPQLTADRS